MSTLRVRLYNVRFGDAVLVSIPDRAPGGAEQLRHVLIDVGNVLGGRGGADSVFAPVIEDVLAVLDGRPLDLYVMTHEHLDHVQGLFQAHVRLGKSFPVDYAWLTASAHPDYYASHEQARKKHAQAVAAWTAIERFLAASPEPSSERLNAVMANNNPNATAQCIEWLRTRARVATTYVHRGIDLAGTHPFSEALFRIWAPEEDTSGYYGTFQPMAVGVPPAGSAPAAGGGHAPALRDPSPPPGVDAGAFYNLVERRRDGVADNLLAIDRAANDTSVVFSIEWRGWRLLFPGDAEHRSWRTMAAREVLAPVHFLKVSHHGSHNGTPPPAILDCILPVPAPDARPRWAGLSTLADTYEGVPDGPTLARLASRCEVRSTATLPDGAPLDFELQG